MKRFLCMLLALTLFLGGCSTLAPISEEAAPSTHESASDGALSEKDKEILSARREKVVSYMNEMATILWRSPESITYTLKSGISPEEDKEINSTRLTIEKGRLYRGIPYTYSGNGLPSFQEFLGQPDENGVSTVQGLDWEDLSGGSALARVGNDCASALARAWSLVSTSVKVAGTVAMCREQGYLPVGNYQVDKKELSDTKRDCMQNGYAKMYDCYALLQAGDGVVCRGNDAGHAMMVTAVHVERDSKGKFLPGKSHITVTHQTREKYQKKISYFDEKLGEEVFLWYGVGDTFSFAALFDKGYLPITCKELIDPAPLPQPTLTDSLTTLSLDTLFQGTLSTDGVFEYIEATVTGESGIAGTLTLFPTRKEKHSFNVKTLKEKGVGSLDIETLPAGQYTFTLTVHLTTGETLTPRTFAFTK